MAGLAGWIRIDDGCSMPSGLVLRMCDALSHGRDLDRHVYEDEGVGLARVTPGILNPGQQPVFNEDRSLCIVMDGEVFGIEGGETDPEAVLRLYEEYGDDFAGMLNGSFTCAIYDFRKKELVIVNDRLATRAVYYTIKDGYVLFASEVKAILADDDVERIVDDQAIMDYFTFGFITGEKTFIKDVNCMPYASIMKAGADRVNISSYWDLEYVEEYPKQPDEYYSKKLAGLLTKAVKRQLDKGGRIAICLSGGFDSRLLTAIARNLDPGRSIPLITFGSKESMEVRIACKVAKKLGWPHHTIPVPPDFLADHGTEGTLMCDAMIGMTFYHTIGIVDEIREIADIIILGTFMDSLFHFGWYDTIYEDPEKLKPSYRSYIETSLGLVSEYEELVEVFDNDYYGENKHLLDDSYAHMNERKQPKRVINRLAQQQFFPRYPKFLANVNNMLMDWVELRMPYMDNDILDFYLTCPPEQIYKGKMITNTFLTLDDKLTGIPLLATRAPVGVEGLPRKAYRLIDKMRNGLRLAAYKLSGGKMGGRPQGYSFQYDKWIREEGRVSDYFKSLLLDERTLSRKYWNSDELRNIVAQHMSGERYYATKLGLIAAFEEFLREHID
ncbi:asparagine synthetase B family protein [Candidatus Altiarchaeota archaeon]